MKKYWFYTLFLLAYGGTNRLFFYIVPFFFIQCCIPAGIPLENGTFLWFFLYIFQRRKAWFFLRLSSLFLLQSCTPVHCSQKTGLIRRTFFESDVQKTQEKQAASGLFAALLNNLPGFSCLPLSDYIHRLVYWHIHISTNWLACFSIELRWLQSTMPPHRLIQSPCRWKNILRH